MSRRHGRAHMPFGKYKGMRISTLPNDYLSWLTGLDLSRFDWLKESLLVELRHRGLNDEMVPPDHTPAECAEPPAEPATQFHRRLYDRGERGFACYCHWCECGACWVADVITPSDVSTSTNERRWRRDPGMDRQRGNIQPTVNFHINIDEARLGELARAVQQASAAMGGLREALTAPRLRPPDRTLVVWDALDDAYHACASDGHCYRSSDGLAFTFCTIHPVQTELKLEPVRRPKRLYKLDGEL